MSELFTAIRTKVDKVTVIYDGGEIVVSAKEPSFISCHLKVYEPHIQDEREAKWVAKYHLGDEISFGLEGDSSEFKSVEITLNGP